MRDFFPLVAGLFNAGLQQFPRLPLIGLFKQQGVELDSFELFFLPGLLLKYSFKFFFYFLFLLLLSFMKQSHV